jgi:glycosyltransferase involved in cell wall biosynthesis
MKKMEHFHPKISIVIPVYNGANYVAEAIDSALNQTYDNVEIIVVNDGSTDNTEEVVKHYGDKVRYFAKQNGGASSALNLGITKMTGEYFSWLSHDDLYYPEKLATEVSALHESGNPNCLVISNWDTVDAQGKILRSQCRPKSCGNLLHDFLFNAPVHGCAALIPKKFFEKVGVFDVENRYVSDVMLFFKLIHQFPYLQLGVSLVKGRVHGKQMTYLARPEHKKQCNVFLCQALDELVGDTAPQLLDDDFLLKCAVDWRQRGYQGAACYAYEKMAKKAISDRLQWRKAGMKNFIKQLRAKLLLQIEGY